jgi:NADH dehydrogenase
MADNKKTRVLVLGAGFGGLTFCQHFHHPGASITVVDRTNHHLFQPLLYQVATAGLSAPEIAQPIRSIFADRPDVTVLLDEVAQIDLNARRVTLEQNVVEYDYLVLALGGRTSYFGHPEWEQFAPGLKTLDDAVHIRSRVLLAFEKAENTEAAAHRNALLTIVVVGGGPTGVELAGAFAELARKVLRRDFRRIDPTQARIVLLEAAPAILSHLPPDLSASAQRQLERLGVQVRTSTRVADMRQGEVHLAGGEVIHTENIIWAAGVSAAPLAKQLGVELDRAGRIKVNPDLSLPGRPEVFAIGDLALVLDEKGAPVPGVSPAAMQMARHVSRAISAELGAKGGSPARAPFKYWDKGTMATIGRSKAVAMVGKFHFSGLLAWLAWLFIHLIYLVGFRNRAAVLLQWIYSYFTYKRGARIITDNETGNVHNAAPAPAAPKPEPPRPELTQASA